MWLIYALAAASFFGIRGIFYQWSSQRPVNRNLMLCGVFFTGTLLSMVFIWSFDSEFTYGVLIGCMMGLFSFVANFSMYRGFSVGKASLIAVISALPPVVVIILAYVIWREQLTLIQFISFIVILAGVLMIRYSSDLSFKQLRGAGWGLLCMLFFGLNDMSSKQATLLEADLYLTLFFMFGTGTLCFFLLYAFERFNRIRGKTHAQQDAAEAAPWSSRRTFGWGMLVGMTNTGGMIFIYQAFDHGVTGLVSAVVALNVLLILLYSRVFLKEKFTPLELSGMLCAIAGIISLRIF